MSIHLPTWEQIPSIDLYLDQVLAFVNQSCQDLGQASKDLTPSMVNNYVKHGYLPKPHKKKYNREQVARLLVLQVYKPLFPIQQLSQVLDLLLQDYEGPGLYQDWVQALADPSHPSQVPLVQSSVKALLAYKQAQEDMLAAMEVDHD